MTKKETGAKPSKNDINQRWGSTIANLGWTAIPNILLERQQALRLNSLDLNILMILLKHAWKADDKPFPTKRVIAELVGRDPSTVRKAIQRLEEKGFIKRLTQMRNYGQTANQYDLSGLKEKLQELAESEKKERDRRQDSDARNRRGYVKPQPGAD